MVDVLALTFAIVMLVAVMQLRGMLSLVFPHITTTLVDAMPAECVKDLVPAAHDELVALGFERVSWLLHKKRNRFIATCTDGTGVPPPK